MRKPKPSRAQARPRRAGAVALVALLLLPVFPAAAGGPEPVPQATADYPLGSWMMYQGGPGHPGQAQTVVPPNGRIVWSYLNQTSDKPEGGAVARGGVVYAPLGKDLTALNLTNGSRLWSYGASGPIQTTPALSNDTVFFGTVVGNEVPNFYAVNTSSGQLRWKANESSTLGDVQFVFSSPVVQDGVVYYGSWTYWFYARNASTGAIVWSAPLTSEIRAAPAVSNGLVFVATQGIHNPTFNVWDVPPRLYAFNAMNGSEVWNRSVPEGHLFASPVVDGDVVYVATGGFSYGITPYQYGYVLAINASDGALLWTSPDIGRTVATPAFAGRTMYVATAGDLGSGITGTTARLRALDLDDQGSVLWSVAVGVQAAMETPPVVILNANGTAAYVAAAGRDGTVGVWLASGVSTPIWSQTLPQDIVAPLAVVSELIMVPSLNGALYAFGARPDLAVGRADIALSDPSPHVGQPVELQVTVHNLGDKAGSGNVTVFLNDSGVPVQIFDRHVESLSFQGTGSVVLREPFTFSRGGNTTIEVAVTNVTPVDGNQTNDRASANFTILQPFAGWASVYSDAANSNYFDSASPENSLAQIEPSYGLGGTGMLALDGAVVFGVGPILWSVNASSAADVFWSQAPSAANIVGTPALSGSMLLATTNDSTAWFIDPDDGAVLGSAALPGPASASPVPVRGGFVVACSDRLVFVSATNLTVELEFQTVSVPPASRPALPTPPAVAGTSVFAISSVGELHAFDLQTGLEAPSFPVALREPTAVPPVVGISHIFAVNGSQNVSSFTLSPLSAVPAREYMLPAPVTGPMSFAYGRLFVPTAPGNLSVISPGSGIFLLNASLPPGATSKGVLAVANNTVFLGNRTLYALSASDGSMLWSFPFEARGYGGVSGPAAIRGGLLHVQTQTGALATFGAVPGLSPIANISSPTNGRVVRVGDTIQFSAEGSYDPDNTSLTFTWRFGDGENGSGRDTTHQYSFTSSQFQVTLTVVDEQGLAASTSIFLTAIENEAPHLDIPTDTDEVTPDPLGSLYVDDTFWTVTVYYADPNGDPPEYVYLHITNETTPVLPMQAVDNGSLNYSDRVTFRWTGQLSSGVHFWNFSTSDGLAGFATVRGNLPVRVYRLEVGEAVPVRYAAKYVGQGNSTPYGFADIGQPAGLGVLTRFRFELPSGASDLVYLNLTVAYNLTSAKLEDLKEETIGLYWYNQVKLSWENKTLAGANTADHTVTANVTNDGVFGVFGQLKAAPQWPVAVISLSPDQSVFLVGEDIVFSAARSLEPNTNNTSLLTYRWDFGDGTNSSLETAVHRYNTTGTYNITLTVTNQFGLETVKTLQISVRTEESTSTFLALAAFLVGGLMLFFLLSPVWRQRNRSPEEVQRREEEMRKARELTRPRAPPAGRGPGGKKGTGGLAEDERRVVEEMDADFEQKVRERGK